MNFTPQVLAGYAVIAFIIGFIAGDLAAKKGYNKIFAITTTFLAGLTSFFFAGLIALLIYGLIPERYIRCQNCGHINHFSRTTCFQCSEPLST